MRGRSGVRCILFLRIGRQRAPRNKNFETGETAWAAFIVGGEQTSSRPPLH
jgi:hypothetical protein